MAVLLLHVVLLLLLVQSTNAQQHALCSSIDVHMFCFNLTLRAKNYKKTKTYAAAARNCFPAVRKQNAASCQISEAELHKEFINSISKADYIKRSATLIVRCQRCVRDAAPTYVQAPNAKLMQEFQRQRSTQQTRPTGKDPFIEIIGNHTECSACEM